MVLLGNARGIKGYEQPNCTKCLYYKLCPPDPVLIYSSPKHRCTRAIDLVTGAMTETDCYAMRHRWGACGPYAKLFEDAPVDPDKPPPPPPPPNKWDIRALLVVLAALAVLALVYWAHEHQADRPRVTQTGEVSVKKVSMKDGSCCVPARTRLRATGGRSLWQVEVSPGDWRDCGNDCEKALRRTLAK